MICFHMKNNNFDYIANEMRLNMRKLKFRAWEDFNNKMYKCMVGNTDKMDDDWICPLV